MINFNDGMVGMFKVLAKFDIIPDSNYTTINDTYGVE